MKLTSDELVSVLSKALPKIGQPPGEMATDCSVVTVPEMIGLLRIAQYGGVTFSPGHVEIDFTVLPEWNPR